MIITPSVSVISPDRVERNVALRLRASGSEHSEPLVVPGAIAYVPLINSHDHLVGNWVPRAGDKRPYPNSHIWVEDMKESFSFHERNNFWANDGSFKLCEGGALHMALLGSYKNLFSGCGTVQDHAPVQDSCYYNSFPVNVISAFRQCHSITLGNWWGGKTASEEMHLSHGKLPFVIHLAEGVDDLTAREFSKLEKQGLLKDNTLMIHGIALSEAELERIAATGASVCWCPSSNYYLIGETLKIDLALKHGVNVVIGTDSTMSGGVNLIAEFDVIHQKHPGLPLNLLYRMVTENAVRALKLPARYGNLDPEHCENLLLVDGVDQDPFENLLIMEAASIQLMVVDGIARFGDLEWMERLKLEEDKYTTFRTGNKEKFVLGDPMELNDEVDAALGYHKDFPYLPF